MKILQIDLIIVFLACISFLVISYTGFNTTTSVAIANSGKTIDLGCQVNVPGEGLVKDAKVTLLIDRFDKNINGNRIVGKAEVSDNPLFSSNSGSSYWYYNVPVLPDDAFYTLKIEHDGRTWDEGNVIRGGLLTLSGSFDKSRSYAIPSGLTNGTLYGYVLLNDPNLSMYDNLASGIKVTLNSCLPYDSSNGNVNTGLVNIPNNPQLSMGGDLVGMYRFDGLEPGFYNVTIEKDGLVGYRIINFTGDKDNDNWIMNNMVSLKHPIMTPNSTTADIQSTAQPQVISTPIPIIQPTSVSYSEEPSGTSSPTSILSPGVSAPPSAGFSINSIVILGYLFIAAGLLSWLKRRKNE